MDELEQAIGNIKTIWAWNGHWLAWSPDPATKNALSVLAEILTAVQPGMGIWIQK